MAGTKINRQCIIDLQDCTIDGKPLREASTAQIQYAHDETVEAVMHPQTVTHAIMRFYCHSATIRFVEECNRILSNRRERKSARHLEVGRDFCTTA